MQSPINQKGCTAYSFLLWKNFVKNSHQHFSGFIIQTFTGGKISEGVFNLAHSSKRNQITNPKRQKIKEKPLGLVLRFSFFEDGSSLKIPSEVFSPLVVGNGALEET